MIDESLFNDYTDAEERANILDVTKNPYGITRMANSLMVAI